MAKRGRGPQQARRRPAAPPAEAEAPLARAWIATAIWLPAVLAFAAYLNALGNPFVYDDARTVVANPSLRDLGNWLFVLVYSRFRPLVNITYAADAAIWAMRPFGFHLTSILLHAVNAALFALLAHAWAVDASERAPRSLGVGTERSRWTLAFVAAALFAVHPLLTEAVGYVSGRPEVLCLTFMLVSLLLLRRGLRCDGRQRWTAMTGAVLAWFLAVLSKETAAVLPIAVFAWDRLLGPGDAPARRRRTWGVHVPLLVLIAAGGLARLYFYRSEVGRLPRPLVQHVLTELPILWRYARSLVWPVGQSIVLPAQRVSTPWKPEVLWSLAALLVIAGVAWRRRRSQPLVAVALLWFPLLLAPSSLIPLVELISEHRMYSASCGLFLLAAALAAGLGERWRAVTEAQRLRRWGVPAATGAVLLALLALTVARNRVWSSNVSLWRDATEKAPLTWAPHYALGDALRIENRCKEAIPVYQRALALLPRDVNTLVNLGICEAREGDLGAARIRFENALSYDPSALRAADNLARVEMLAGNDALARKLLEKVLHLDPRDTVALVNLAELAANSGDSALVEQLCAQARAVAPRAEGVATCGRPSASGPAR